MAKDIDIRNRGFVLLKAMGILHERVQLQYSFCCSLSGCLPSRVAVNSQGAAIGENMLRHSVLSSIAELFKGRQSLQGLGRYSLLQCSFCCSPSGCLPSRVAVNSQGAAIGENMLRHSVPSSIAELFRGRQSLQGLGRYSLLQCSFCCSLQAACLPAWPSIPKALPLEKICCGISCFLPLRNYSAKGRACKALADTSSGIAVRYGILCLQVAQSRA